MKRTMILIGIIAALTVPVFADYPPEGWTDSITDAIELAMKEDRKIILNFTGSDWCTYCITLDQNVWSTDEFSDWADDNAVPVFLDFPNKIEQSTETLMQNYGLKQYFGVQGYPTIYVLDSDLIPVLQTGFSPLDADDFIAHLDGDSNLIVDSPEEFKQDFLSYIEMITGPVQ